MKLYELNREHYRSVQQAATTETETQEYTVIIQQGTEMEKKKDKSKLRCWMPASQQDLDTAVDLLMTGSQCCGFGILLVLPAVREGGKMSCSHQEEANPQLLSISQLLVLKWNQIGIDNKRRWREIRKRGGESRRRKRLERGREERGRQEEMREEEQKYKCEGTDEWRKMARKGEQLEQSARDQIAV